MLDLQDLISKKKYKTLRAEITRVFCLYDVLEISVSRHPDSSVDTLLFREARQDKRKIVRIVLRSKDKKATGILSRYLERTPLRKLIKVRKPRKKKHAGTSQKK